MTGSGNRESAVSTVTRLWSRHPKNSDSIPGNNKKFTSSPKRPDVFWGPSSVLINGCWWLYPWEQCDVEVKNLLRRLRMELYFHSPMCVMACLRTIPLLFECPWFHRFQIDICIINAKVIIRQEWHYEVRNCFLYVFKYFSRSNH